MAIIAPMLTSTQNTLNRRFEPGLHEFTHRMAEFGLEPLIKAEMGALLAARRSKDGSQQQPADLDSIRYYIEVREDLYSNKALQSYNLKAKICGLGQSIGARSQSVDWIQFRLELTPEQGLLFVTEKPIVLIPAQCALILDELRLLALAPLSIAEQQVRSGQLAYLGSSAIDKGSFPLQTVVQALHRTFFGPEGAKRPAPDAQTLRQYRRDAREICFSRECSAPPSRRAGSGFVEAHSDGFRGAILPRCRRVTSH